MVQNMLYSSFSQCKNEENVIQLKAYNKNKHMIRQLNSEIYFRNIMKSRSR